jgi:hypothetical protein
MWIYPLSVSIVFFLAICRMEFLSCDFCDFPTCTCQDLPMAHVSITLVSDLTCDASNFAMHCPTFASEPLGLAHCVAAETNGSSYSREDRRRACCSVADQLETLSLRATVLSYLQHWQDSQKAPHGPLILSVFPVLFQLRSWDKVNRFACSFASSQKPHSHTQLLPTASQATTSIPHTI